MKKIIILILCLTMLITLSACNMPEVSPIETGDVNNTATSQSVNTTQPAETTSTQPVEISFQEVTVIDNENCTIKITDIEPDNMWGYTLNAYIENKSASTTFVFSLTSAAVNGVQVEPLLAAEVAAGKKANKEITFYDAFPDSIDIGTYTDIELNFRVYDSNDWTAEPIATPSIHIYPLGEENATIFSRVPMDSDNIIVDNEYVTVIVTGYRDDELWGYTVDLFLINKTDMSVMLSADEVSVNGYMADPFYADSVSAGKCAFSSISWPDSTFEENKITMVENIEFQLRAYDENNWLAEDLVNETITLNP